MDQNLANLLSIIISSLTLLVLVVSVILVLFQVNLLRKQIKNEHDWNRRKASQDLLFNLVDGEIVKIRNKLESEFGVDILSGNQTYDRLISSIPEDKKNEFEFNLKALLNYFETIAIGLKFNVLVEDVCFDYICVIMSKYTKWADSFIKKIQLANPYIWIEFLVYIKKWAPKVDPDISEKLVKPGLGPIGN